MKGSARSFTLILIAICLLSIALRYPLVEHQRLNDTYVMHVLANSIRDRGEGQWIFSPLSYFGYYPASYPSGMPFLLAELSELTGLSVNSSILLVDFFVGIALVLGVFCLSRIFIRRTGYVLLAVFLAAVAPRIVDSSYWSASPRAPFVVLAVITVFVAFKANSMSRRSMYALFGFLLVGCISLHHMGVLFFLFGIAYVLGTAGSYIAAKAKVTHNLRGHYKSITAAYLLGICVAIAVVAFFFLSYFSRDLRYNFEETPLFSFEPESLAIALHVAASYTNQIGFVLPVAILGSPLLLKSVRIPSGTLFLILLPVMFIPLLPNSLYISMLLSPFIAILGALVLNVFCDNFRKKVALAVVAVLICSSIVLPLWSVSRWNLATTTSEDTVEVEHQCFNDGAYLAAYSGRAYLISNVDVSSVRLSAISGTLYLGSSVQATLTGDVTEEEVKGNLSWAQERFPQNLYSWYSSEQAPELEFHVLSIYVYGVEYAGMSVATTPSGDPYFGLHQKVIASVDVDWPDNYVWQWGNFPAKLPWQMKNAEWQPTSSSVARPMASYLTYQSEGVSYYLVEIPV